MGIPPYVTPEERARMQAHIKHYHEWLIAHGYNNCYELDPDNFDRYLPRTEFKSPEGETYNTSEGFYKGHGYYPGLEKDGVCYGYYEPRQKGEYIDPWDTEVAFLEAHGYTRIFKELSADYLENNRLLEEFYKAHGFVPRWQKDGQEYGHEQLLEAEGYKYEY